MTFYPKNMPSALLKQNWTCLCLYFGEVSRKGCDRQCGSDGIKKGVVEGLPGGESLSVVEFEEVLDEVKSLPGGVLLVVFVDELLVVGGLLSLDIPVVEGHDDVEADVVLAVGPPLAQFVLLDVADNLLGPQQFGQLEDLVDLVVAHQKGGLLENLRNNSQTIPARIIPAAQQSTR